MHDPRLNPTTCRGKTCDAPIAWVASRRGKFQPIDLEPNPEGNLVLTSATRKSKAGTVVPVADTIPHGQTELLTVDRYMPHHATCPDVDTFRS